MPQPAGAMMVMWLTITADGDVAHKRMCCLNARANNELSEPRSEMTEVTAATRFAVSPALPQTMTPWQRRSRVDSNVAVGTIF